MLNSRRLLTLRSAAFALAAVVSAAFQLSASAAPGDLYVTDTSSHSVLVFKPDGTSTILDSALVDPQGITFDASKNLYVADAGDGLNGNGVVYKYVPPYTSRTTFATGLTTPTAITFNMGVAGDLLVSETSLDKVTKIRPDGLVLPDPFVAVTAPLGLLSNGNFVYVVSAGDVIKIASDSTQTVYYDHTGSMADGNALNVAADNVMDAADNIFISTDTGVVLKETPLGAQTTFASGFMDPRGMDFRPRRFSGDTMGVGNLFVADTAGTIFQVTPDQVKTTFSTTAASPNYLVFEVSPTPIPTPTPTPTATPTPTPTATPTPTPNPTATPVLFQNISTRAQVQTGDNVLIGGFIVTGGSADKTVILRAIGPSLPVTGALANPVLELHEPDGTVVTNNDWKDDQKAQIMATGLAPTNDKESAIVATLSPVDPSVAGTGQYTVIVRGNDGGTGIALVEIYDLDDPATSLAQLANISTRGFVGSGEDALIGGIIVGPTNNVGEVIVRALGPSLANVTDPLQDPTIELVDEQGVRVAFNDNWRNSPKKDEIVAQNLAPSNDAEAVVDAVLPAGNYTAVVRSVDATTGVGLVEAYHIQDNSSTTAK